jgi:O-antigen/teichoic acid export membrane protein
MLASVLKRAGGLGIGTAIGQGVVLAGTPFLVRTYGPASFGILALLLTATNISIAVGCARFDLALPSAPDGDVAPLARLCTGIAAGLAAVVVLVALLLEPLLAEGAFHELVRHPLLLGLAVLSGALFQLVSSAQLRQGAITVMAGLRALQGVIFVALALVPAIGLLWAQALSYAPALLLLPTVLKGGGTSGAVRAVAARYSTFATLGLPGAILDVVGYSLCIWIVTYAYGATGSGELSQVQRIVGAPLMLVSISLGQILLRQSAEMVDDPVALRRLLIRLLTLMAGGAVAALVVLAIVGEPVLKLVLGSKWDVDTRFILAISTAVFVRAIVSPVSAVLATARRFDLALRWQMLYFTSALLLFTVASRSLPLNDFVIFYALHEMVLYLIYLRIIMSLYDKART